MTTTPTGVPVTLCRDCGVKHPVTRHHCVACGRNSLFLDATSTCPACCEARDSLVTLKSGSLFSGYGGLDMGVTAALARFGIRLKPAWFCEFDAAPSKILAHHWPDVPNFGDVTKVDFAAVEQVDVATGGFPCQDVSLAGRRKGMKDGTRSGLWSEFRRLIETQRPRLVVIENVRGLLSADAAGEVESCPWCLGDDDEQHALRALGAVLGDLAELGFDAEWTGIQASEVGAPHGRFRVFIIAWPRQGGATTENTGR